MYSRVEASRMSACTSRPSDMRTPAHRRWIAHVMTAIATHPKEHETLSTLIQVQVISSRRLFILLGRREPNAPRPKYKRREPVTVSTHEDRHVPCSHWMHASVPSGETSKWLASQRHGICLRLSVHTSRSCHDSREMWIRGTPSHLKTNVEQALTLQAAACTKLHLRRHLRPRHESLEFETRQAELLTRLTSASMCRQPGQAKLDQPSQLVPLRREDNSCQRLTDFQPRGQRCATLATRDPEFQTEYVRVWMPRQAGRCSGRESCTTFPVCSPLFPAWDVAGSGCGKRGATHCVAEIYQSAPVLPRRVGLSLF